MLAYLFPCSLLLCGCRCKRPEETPKPDTKLIYFALKFFVQIRYMTLILLVLQTGVMLRNTIYSHLQNSTQCVYTTYNILSLANFWWHLWNRMIEFSYNLPSPQWRFHLGVELMVDFTTFVTWPKQVASIFLFGNSDFVSSVQKCLPLIGQIEFKVK